jgi:hypothetical protein
MRRVTCSLASFGFSGLPAPAVQAYWYIPRLKRGEWALFLVDTGASGTSLNGLHAIDLQPFMRPNTLVSGIGAGGETPGSYTEWATIVLLDDALQLLSLRAKIGVQCIPLTGSIDPSILKVPPLLGRNILRRCVFRYAHSRKQATLTFPLHT